MLTTEELEKAQEYFSRYLARAQSFLARVEEALRCEICYERPRSCGYKCKRHQVCHECFSRTALCPFCRAPPVGVCADLWYLHPGGAWQPLTVQMMRHGLRERLEEKYTDASAYAEWFRRTCVAAITELQIFQGHPESLKMSLRVMAQSVNKRANYPIFAWHKKVSVQFCKDRWRVILDAIVAKTNPPPEEAPLLKEHLKKSLAGFLRQMKASAEVAGLRLAPSP